jgi:hypothetical protein
MRLLASSAIIGLLESTTRYHEQSHIRTRRWFDTNGRAKVPSRG